MHDEHPHHLLAQVPLTVSPFLSLPTQTTLPYTYKQLPSTLPPSVIDTPQSAPPNDSSAVASGAGPATTGPKPAYVTSSSGHSAHPDDIIASCRALQAHLLKMQEEARETVRRWEDGIRERELAEKRRVAPGWLDEDVRMLVPEKAGNASSSVAAGTGNAGAAGPQDVMMMDGPSGGAAPQRDSEQAQRDREGEELDRAFGGLGLR